MTTRTLNQQAIQQIVKIGSPGLMLDTADVDSTGRVVAQRTLAASEPAFVGHFPGHPILPGVLQVEAMRQAALLAVDAIGGPIAARTRLSLFRNIKFRRPVNPGDVLKIELSVHDKVDVAEGAAAPDPDATTFAAVCTVDGQVTSEGRLTVTLETPAAPAGPDTFPTNELARTQDGIEAAIPHRHPFLFIERTSYQGVHPVGGIPEIIGIKTIHPDGMYMAPPGAACVPPGHLAEMSAQSGCVYLLGLEQNRNRIAYFMSMDADFFRPVVPGDVVANRVRLTALRDKFGRCESDIEVRGVLVATCSLKFAFVDK